MATLGSDEIEVKRENEELNQLETAMEGAVELLRDFWGSLE